jgi:hypothetical protein
MCRGKNESIASQNAKKKGRKVKIVQGVELSRGKELAGLERSV